jgi:cobalt-zinc-cadmium efflux system outer membrane protein
MHPSSLAMRAVCALALALSSTMARPAPALALSLEEALALARERAPEVLLARAALAEARGDLTTAELPVADDPSITATGGPRYTEAGAWIPQLQVGVEQRLELSGARSARIDAALAAIDRAEAGGREAMRAAVLAVGVAFVDALHARDAASRAAELRERAGALLAIGEARSLAGDIGAIEVRRLRIAAAQARADEHAARATGHAAAALLRALLDLPFEGEIVIEGSLDDVVAAVLHAEATERPELDLLRAATRQADAEGRIAEGLSVPELGIGAGYQLEEGDHMALLTLSLTLPFFDRGRGARVAADARRDALESELSRRDRAITLEVAAARRSLEAMVAALAESARAVDEAVELDAMLRRSWEAGETSLTELLIVGGEVAAALRAHLDRTRAAAHARVVLEAAVGGAR